MDYVIYFAITIGILVFIHEFGHFAAAKLLGMRADVFAIGFGKRLFGWNKINGFTFGDLPEKFDGQGNTDYRLSLLPLGGYVKIAGMVDESFDTEFANQEPKPYEFRVQPTWKKIIVITAGVIMNLILALMVFWWSNFFRGREITKTTSVGFVVPKSKADSLGFEARDKILSINGSSVENWDDVRTDVLVKYIGQNLSFKINRNGANHIINVGRSELGSEDKQFFLIPDGVKPGVVQVLPNSPASKGGLKEGDIFLSINKSPIYSSQEVTQIISSHKNIPIPVVVERGKDTLNLSVIPGSNGMIGIGLGDIFTGPVEIKTYGFFSSFYYAGGDIISYADLTVQMIGKVFSGKVAFGKVFGGPIKIAEFAVKSADNGLLSFIYFLAFLSLSLALINIFPFPALDGGHLVMIIVEGIMKKEIPIKVKVAIQNAGFVILLLLMAFIIYNDIMNL